MRSNKQDPKKRRIFFKDFGRELTQRRFLNENVLFDELMSEERISMCCPATSPLAA